MLTGAPGRAVVVCDGAHQSQPVPRQRVTFDPRPWILEALRRRTRMGSGATAIRSRQPPMQRKKVAHCHNPGAFIQPEGQQIALVTGNQKVR